MKVLHLASFDRWTGAAAVAFAEAEALRSAGVDAHYGYVGGYLLEEKIGRIDWAHPVLVPGERPVPVLRNLRAIRSLARREKFDLVHCHLSYDHWLARLSLGRGGPGLIRTFHSARALRTGLLTKWLISGTRACAVVSPPLLDSRALEGRTPVFTPPPLEPRYVPNGLSARPLYGLEPETTVIGCIGKLSPGRGFEEAIETFAKIHYHRPSSKLMIVGHGPHRGKLEELVEARDLVESVIFAGYHEVDLPEHFRAMDLMLFTAPGSDLGHRAIIEANGCGTPVVSYPIPGADFMIGDMAGERIAEEATPQSLAKVAILVLPDQRSETSSRVAESAARFNYERTASRLRALYEAALAR